MRYSKKDSNEKELPEKTEEIQPVKNEKEAKPDSNKIQFIHNRVKSGKLFIQVDGESLGFEIKDGIFEIPNEPKIINQLEREKFKRK